ncbi:MAG: hypothetical protein Q9191_005900, partial [Dirinaria sp. TL-2023a]
FSRNQCVRRQYHSYEHDNVRPFSPTESAILSHGIAHVPTKGFHVDALTCGARDVGYQDVSVNLFPAGAFALVNYHLLTQRLAIADSGLPNMDKNDVALNIKELVLRRLHGNKPIVHRWQEALALMATPSHLPTSLRELSFLSDEILFQAGDTSVDTSWYTKRAALSAVYASSELFMTTDKSTDFIETEAFLSRRLEESSSLGQLLSGAGTWLGVQTMGVVNGLRSKGVRI